MISSAIPIKLFNSLTHEDGDTIDHISEGETAADLETVAGKVTTLETNVGDWDVDIWSTATGSAEPDSLTTMLETLLGDYDKSAISTATSSDGTIYAVLDSLATEVNYSAFDTGAPTMAVAATKTLTIGTKPTEGATVSMGGVTYKFRATALGAGVAASAVLTSNESEIADGDTVTIGTTVYRFKDTTAAAYDVKRNGTTADTTLGNLVKAVNASGEGDGSDYHAGTLIHPTVGAGAVTAHAITFTAKSVGFAGNAIAKAKNEECTELDWDGDGEVFTGGIDAQAANDVYDGGDVATCIINLKKAVNLEGTIGTHYGTGTVVNPIVEIPSLPEGGYSDTTITARNKVKGTVGNATAIGETLADGSWAGNATKLAGGVNGTTAAAAGKVKYIDGVLYTTTKACTTADSSGWNVQYLNSNVTKTLDLSGGTSYTMTATDGIGMIVVTETDGSDGKIILPPATGSQRKIVFSIQKAGNNITLDPAAVPGTDTINTASSKAVTALSTITLLDYASGKWITL